MSLGRPSRRTLLLGLAASAVAGRAAVAAEDALAALEARNRCRLGVFAIDTGSGRSLAHRADERFLMCSTAKLASAAAVLKRVDAGAERLDRRVAYGPADLAGVGYAPDTKAHLAEGGLPVEALCRAAIEHSDNGAANLILASLGGPAAVTRFVRGFGDTVSRFDRTEPSLNHPDADRDTTTPRAFAGTARTLLLGEVLSAPSKARLEGWMRDCTTGLARLRAGIPKDWIVGDKTGTAGPIAADVAILRPPGRPPIVAAATCEASGLKDAERDAVLREAGTIVASLARP